MVSSSIIWESTGVRSLFGSDGIAGLVNIDITPDLALRLAQAFGSILPTKSHVVVSRDSSRAARMIKRAMVAGLNSTGNNVRDLRGRVSCGHALHDPGHPLRGRHPRVCLGHRSTDHRDPLL